MNPIKPWVTLALAAACLLVGLLVGWSVNGWRLGAAQADQVKADAKTQSDLAAKQAADLAKKLDDVAEHNRWTEASISTMTTQLGEQNNVISKLRAQLAGHPAGRCSFTPDALRVMRSAYEAAMPGATGTAAEGKAGLGDAGHPLARPASGGPG